MATKWQKYTSNGREKEVSDWRGVVAWWRSDALAQGHESAKNKGEKRIREKKIKGEMAKHLSQMIKATPSSHWQSNYVVE